VLFIYLCKPCTIPILLLECYSGYSSALCPTAVSAAMHKRMDHQKANGKKWGMLKDFYFWKVCGTRLWRLKFGEIFTYFLGAFAELRKATISIVMSVRLSSRLHGAIRLPLKDFHETWYIFKTCRETSSFIQIGQESRVLYMKTNIHFVYHISLLSSQNEKCFRQKL